MSRCHWPDAVSSAGRPATSGSLSALKIATARSASRWISGSVGTSERPPLMRSVQSGQARSQGIRLVQQFLPTRSKLCGVRGTLAISLLAVLRPRDRLAPARPHLEPEDRRGDARAALLGRRTLEQALRDLGVCLDGPVLQLRPGVLAQRLGIDR